MTKNVVIKNLLVRVLKALLAEGALQEMALHMSLVLSGFNLFRKYIIADGAFP